MGQTSLSVSEIVIRLPRLKQTVAKERIATITNLNDVAYDGKKQSKVGSLPLSQWRRFSCSFPFRDFGTFSLASGQNDKDSFTVSEVTRLELLVRHLEICTDQSVQRLSCLHIRMKSGRQLRKNRADESLCLNLAYFILEGALVHDHPHFSLQLEHPFS